MADKQAEGSHVYHMVAFSFVGEKTAAEIMRQIEAAQKFSGYDIVAQAVVEVDNKGKVHVHQPGRGGVGAGVGAVTGGLLALIGGPAGLLIAALAGGTIGGIAGHFIGRQFDQDALKQLGDQMVPGSSAIVVIVEDVYSQGLINAASEYKGDVITLTIGDEASGEIASFVAAGEGAEAPAEDGGEAK